MSNKPNKTISALEKLKQKKKPVIRRAVLCGDYEIADEYQEALRKMSQLEAQGMLLKDSPAGELVAQEIASQMAVVQELRDRVNESAVVFRFRSIGRDAYEALLTEHPPTPEEIEDHVKEGGKAEEVTYSPSTFPPALCGACIIEPEGIGPEEILQIWSDPDYNQTELVALFNAAQEANTVRMLVDLGKGSSQTHS